MSKNTQKPNELPVYHTFRQLAVFVGLEYSKLRYLHRSPVYGGLVQPDAWTSIGDPLFSVETAAKIKKDLTEHDLLRNRSRG